MKFKRLLQSKKWSILLSTIFLPAIIVTGPVAPISPASAYITDVRYIQTAEQVNVANPVGLAYSPLAGGFQIAGSQANGADNPQVTEMSMYAEPAGQTTVVDSFSDPVNLAFNAKSNSLYHLNQKAGSLDQIPAQASGQLPASVGVSARFDIWAYGLSQAEGMTFNPDDGTLYLLDPAGKRMVRVSPDANGNYDGTKAIKSGRLQRIDLKSLGASHLRGIAYNPANGNLYVLGPKEKLLYEITTQGSLVNTFDLSDFTLRDPGGMVFAPSGDNTDDPAIQDLFIADSGQVQGQASVSGSVVELSMTAAVLQALPALRNDLTLLNTIQTFNWNPPSPDPTGVVYRPETGGLLVVDSEVDEMKIWHQVNAWEATTSGNVFNTCNTSSFSHEVADVTENTDNGHLFMSDDGKLKVFEIDLGPDGKYCTSDDTLRSFSAYSLYGDTDPEGIAYGQGKLFITGGLAAEVYVVDPGPNGRFGDSDDTFTHWDTASLGIGDPEGIGYRASSNSLFLVSRKKADTTLVETTINGSVLNRWDTSSFNMKGPSGVGVAPNSMFISARGVDNNQDPNENDGKIYEFNVP